MIMLTKRMRFRKLFGLGVFNTTMPVQDNWSPNIHILQERGKKTVSSYYLQLQINHHLYNKEKVCHLKKYSRVLMFFISSLYVYIPSFCIQTQIHLQYGKLYTWYVEFHYLLLCVDFNVICCHWNVLCPILYMISLHQLILQSLPYIACLNPCV